MNETLGQFPERPPRQQNNLQNNKNQASCSGGRTSNQSYCFGRLRQKNPEFEVIVSYLHRPCLKNKTKKKKIQTNPFTNLTIKVLKSTIRACVALPYRNALKANLS